MLLLRSPALFGHLAAQAASLDMEAQHIANRRVALASQGASRLWALAKLSIREQGLTEHVLGKAEPRGVAMWVGVERRDPRLGALRGGGVGHHSVGRSQDGQLDIA